MEITIPNIKGHEYYKQIDCPMAILEQHQQRLMDNINDLFYTEPNQLSIKNEICFIDNGILLFNRFNIFIGTDGKVYIKVMTVLDIDWFEKLNLIYESMSIITLHLSQYTEQLFYLSSANDVSYGLVNQIIMETIEAPIGKELVFNIHNPFEFGVFALTLILTKINNISFEYKLVALEKIHTMNSESVVSNILTSATLPQNDLTKFVHKLLYHGEIIKKCTQVSPQSKRTM